MSWSIRIRGELYDFPDKVTVNIGRDENSDLKLQSRSVDRAHAVLGFDAAKRIPYVKDLGSANGTHLNELRIPPNEVVSVAVRDIIKIGYDNSVLRIEEVPKHLSKQKIPANPPVGTSVDRTEVSEESIPHHQISNSPLLGSLPTHDTPGTVPYMPYPQMQASTQQTPVLPATHGAVSYVPMTYYVPVTAAGMGIPVNPHVLSSASGMQPLPPSQHLPLQPPLLPDMHAPHPVRYPATATSTTNFERPFFQHVAQTGLKKDIENGSGVGELTMALLDLESDGDANTLAPQPHRMPTMESDVSSTFTSVSKSDANTVKPDPVKRTGSLKRYDGRRPINVSESPTLSHSSNLYGDPEWWIDKKKEEAMENLSRSRSSSTNSDDLCLSRKPHKHSSKKGPRKVSNAPNDVRSTDEGFAAEDEGSDSNIEVPYGLNPAVPITAKSVERVASQEEKHPRAGSPESEPLEVQAQDEQPSQMQEQPVDLAHVPSTPTTTVTVPPTSHQEQEEQSSNSVEEAEAPLQVGTTWTIHFEDDHVPKSRRSMPVLTTTKKAEGNADSNKPRRSYTPAANMTVTKTPKTVTPGKSSLSHISSSSKSKSSTRPKATGKPGVSGDSGPFLRNTTQRRTYTKKTGTSSPDIPVVDQKNKNDPVQVTPEVVKSHRTSVKGKVGDIRDRKGSRGKPVFSVQKQATPKTPRTHLHVKSSAPQHKSTEQTVLVHKGRKLTSPVQKSSKPRATQAKHAHDSVTQAVNDITGTSNLDARKVVGGEATLDIVSVHSVGNVTSPDRRESLPTGVDSVIIAAHFGHTEGEGYPKDSNQAELGKRNDFQTPATLSRLHAAEGTSFTGAETPNDCTPLSVGPATSSPKEQQTTHVQPNTLSPVPMQLTVTSSGGDPSEVDSLDGPRVGSARRQWNQPQSVVVEGLALSSMEEVSKQVAELADGSLHKLINLRTAMEERRLLIDSLPVAEDSYDTGSHYPLTMWKSLPKEVFEIFQSLKETEGKLKEMNHCMDLLSKQFEPTSELRTRRKIDSDS
jgi:hypothetical protein